MSGSTHSEVSMIDARSFTRQNIGAILRRVHSEGSGLGPLLLCFLSGEDADACTEPMLRDPAPPIGTPFGDDFPDELMSALTANSAVHDGAILFRRSAVTAPYLIEGWSQRLMAPSPANHLGKPNRGSAYNSCLATSGQAGVDSVVLLTRGCVYIFENGTEKDTFDV